MIKISKRQPWKLWFFVVALNLTGLLGFFFLKSKGIDIYLLNQSN